MAQRYFINFLVLAAIITPLFTFAQAAQPKVSQEEKQAAAQNAQIHKNRLDRVGNAINAAEANILSLEKHIFTLEKGITLLTEAGADLRKGTSYMDSAKDQVARAKQVIAEMKGVLPTFDTKNQEQIAFIRGKIKEVQSHVHASRDALKEVFVAIRALPLKRESLIIKTEAIKPK